VANEPNLLTNVQASLQAAGVAYAPVSQADVSTLQGMAATAGLPPQLVQALQVLGTSDAQIDDIQNQFTSQDPAATAGSLSATLADPAFNTLVQNSAQALMATVLLSGRLSPASDTGVSDTDGITNGANLTFAGTAPPGTMVELFAQRQVDATPMMIGQGVSDATGKWQITADHLNDGSYAISARFSGGDSGFGQVTPLTQIVVVSVAPRITAVLYNRKTGMVTVTFNDPSFIDLASLANSAFFVARTGKHSPPLTLTGFQRIGTQVMFIVSKGRKHLSTIYLQVVSGGIRDVAGNALDGEFNGSFPSGNGQPGGDFFAKLPIVLRKAAKTRKTHHKAKH
jgi:hypothetical protein